MLGDVKVFAIYFEAELGRQVLAEFSFFVRVVTVVQIRLCRDYNLFLHSFMSEVYVLC